MKKYIYPLLFISTFGFLVACTDNNAKKQENETENSKQEESATVHLDETKYGLQDEVWELSPTFEHSIEDTNGKKHSYKVVGSKEGIGFTGPFPITANEKQKYFWFYFGGENIYDLPVKVKAIKKGTEEWVDVLSNPSTFYEGAQVSPDSVNMPSHLNFPSAGIWKVVVSIDGKIDETIVLEVV